MSSMRAGGKRRILSIRSRLVMTTTTVTMVVVALSLPTNWILLRHLARERSKDTIESIATLLSHDLMAGLDFDLHRSVRETLAGVFRIDEIRFAAVTNPDGSPYEALGALPDCSLPSQVKERIEVARQDNLLVAHAPIVDNAGSTIGLLHIGYSLEEMQNTQKRGITVLLLAGVLLICAGAIVTRQSGLRVTEPILELAEAARSLAKGKFHRPLVIHRQDEVGTVAMSFNEMAARLEAAHSELEQKVRERTGELRQKNLELAMQNEKVREASRLKSAFLANMSHELRTPLNGILALSELLHDEVLGPMGSEEQKAQVGMIHQSGENLLGLINEVLDLSKIEAGKIEIVYQRIEPNDILRTAAAQMESLAHAKGIEFRTDFSGEGEAWADADRIRQVFLNLVGNAIKFTDRGSVEVFVKLDIEGESLSVTIKDTGIGIPAEEQDSIFQEFRQVDGTATRRYGGTGLGLAICRRLVNLMGGEISVESAIGRGSTFAFHVPAHAEMPEQAPGEETEDSPLATLKEEVERTLDVQGAGVESLRDLPLATRRRGNEGHSCILVVDDDELLLSTLARYLAKEGFDVELARDGKQALQTLKERNPDLMVLDLMMPGMSGFEVIDAIRGEHPTAKIPVVVYTAKILTNKEMAALQASVSRVLHKGTGGIRLLVEGIHESIHRRDAA